MAGPFSSFKLQVREGSPTKSNVDPQADAHGVVVGEEIGCLFEFAIAGHGFVLWADEVIHHEAVAARLLEPGRPRWLRYCDANDAGGMEDGAMAEPKYRGAAQHRRLVRSKPMLSALWLQLRNGRHVRGMRRPMGHGRDDDRMMSWW